MKICPRCKMRIDAEYECPMCHVTITYEPEVCEKKEKYIFNKYLLSHLIKNSWYKTKVFKEEIQKGENRCYMMPSRAEY